MSDIPAFDFDLDEMAAIREQLQSEVPAVETVISETPVQPKRRGRPPGSKNRAKVVSEDGIDPFPVGPAPLTKRDEREVSSRLTNILTGGTGVLSLAKDYLVMTDDEAKAIADPLASYLVRNADVMPIARQVLENYDLAAITLGVAAYSVRVYHDRSIEVAATKRERKSSALDRVGTATDDNQSGQEVRSLTNFIPSAPSGGGSVNSDV
jgi:hypothetical protein